MPTDSNFPPRPACRPGHQCNCWRSCDYCARRRQTRIADAAEKLAGAVGAIDWTTITPESQSMAAAVRERGLWLRAAHPPGAIWTIERGIDSGKLHINILAPSGLGAALPRSAQHRITRVDNPRAVAAYISKREQAPSAAEWPGRTFGTAGPLWQWLTAKGQATPIQAAAIQADINRAAGPHPHPPPAQAVRCAADLPAADYRAIMARRVPDLVAAVGRCRPAPPAHARPAPAP